MANRGEGIFYNWWATIDRVTLGLILVIICFSAIMVTTASPAVAERIGLGSFHFIKKHLFYLVISLFVIFICSLLPTHLIKKLSLAGTILFGILLVLVLFFGQEVKGSRRWISLLGFSLQPSEFIKPFFAILTGWILSVHKDHFPAVKLSFVLYVLLIALVIMQPDLGMAVTISAIWAGQLFLAGLPILWVIAVLFFGVLGLLGAYTFLPHVAHRIDNFMNPDMSENYQISKSISAFVNGGFFGKGPGEGVVKQHLPDSHTDFIFAVIGEELGIIACIIVICLYATIIIRNFIIIAHKNDLFISIAASGLLLQFSTQAIINMGVTVHLLPTKGMTLPFISYGGSSTIAISAGVGMLLALTKKRYEFRKDSRFQEIWQNLAKPRSRF